MPLTFSRISCIAKFELVRLFFTKTGILTLTAFTALWLVTLYFPISSAVDIVYSDTFADAAEHIFGMFGLQALLNWPVPELAMYWLVAIYSFPLFSLLLSSDQTCADRQRGTLRFIALRATRLEIILGRFIGQVIILMLLITLTLIATILMATFRDPSLLGLAVPKAILLLVELFFVVLPFIAIMTLFNSFTLSAKVSLIGSVLFFTLAPLFISGVSYFIVPVGFLEYLIPGMQIDSMLNLQQLDWSTYFIPLAQTLLFIVAARFILNRSSI